VFKGDRPPAARQQEPGRHQRLPHHGWRYAIPVGIFDVAKGAVPVLILGPAASAMPGSAGVRHPGGGGHVFSVFVGFKGGKGVATSAGVVLAWRRWRSASASSLGGDRLGERVVSLGSVVAAGIFRAGLGVLSRAARGIWLYWSSRRSSSGCTAPTFDGSRRTENRFAPLKGAHHTMTRIGVLGGELGTTLADLLARKATTSGCGPTKAKWWRA